MSNLADLFKLGQDSYVIAEVATEHFGDVSRAKQLIDLAKKSGANAVKFQHVIPGEIYPPRGATIQIQGEKIDVSEHFRKTQMDENFLSAIANHTQQVGIDLMITAYGIQSLQEIGNLPIKAHKVASPELTHPFLLREHQKHSLPLILSTGASKWEDILYARSYFSKERICFLQCVTQYPADPQDYNLLTMFGMGNSNSGVYGVSDHSRCPYEVPGLAYGLCCLNKNRLILEKHLTVGDDQKGIDQTVSLDPQEFLDMMRFLEKIKREVTNKYAEEDFSDLFECKEQGKILQPKAHQRISEVLSEVTKIPVERVVSILGDGRKTLTPGEKKLYQTTNRTIFATRDIVKGGVISEENVGYFRSEVLGEKGMGYEFFSRLGGVRTAIFIKEGQQITQDMVASFCK